MFETKLHSTDNSLTKFRTGETILFFHRGSSAHPREGCQVFSKLPGIQGFSVNGKSGPGCGRRPFAGRVPT